MAIMGNYQSSTYRVEILANFIYRGTLTACRQVSLTLQYVLAC